MLASFGGCNQATTPGEQVGEAKAAQFTNGSFETGTPGMPPPAPWTVTDLLNPNPNGYTVQTPQTYAGLNLVAQGMACTNNNQCDNANFGTCQGGFCKPSALTVVLSSAAGPQPDPFVGKSLTYCRYGAQCAIVNQGGHLSNVNQLSQTMTVTAADVDPNDNKVHIRAAVAPVLEDPGHAANQEPYFFVQIVNVTQGNAVLYENFNFANQPGVAWQTAMQNGNTYRYTSWQLIDVAPGAPAINMGDSIEIDLVAAGCSIGGHVGQLYVDGVGTAIPGLFVNGTAPSQVNAPGSLTYTLTYTNGSPSTACTTANDCPDHTETCTGSVCAENGVTLTFTAPPGTTISGFTPPPGATCTQAAQTITCTFTGPVPPGATGMMTVTVAVPAGATGTLVEGDYGIASAQEGELLGNVIVTNVGCTQDSQCTPGNWCFESMKDCTPTLANGTPIPTDKGHMNPTLNGTCTAAAGTLVCTSGVCDTADSACGYANGDGPCTSANGAVVCRSGVCDPDGSCGYANGDGPCTSANGSIVCRTGVCDPTNNLCGYMNGDGPCTSGTVCQSAVCDTDMLCGYKNGDGPCTPGAGGNGGVVCRSQMCASSGVCEGPNGCQLDTDCSTGNWCNETSNMCTPAATNGNPVGMDPAHMDPMLPGTCTTAAGALTCVSGVCDTKDNDCGYANGDGPCTSANGGTVCRSGTCSTTGVCEPAGGCVVDADCSKGNWCDETKSMCVPTAANGQPVGMDPAHTNPSLPGTCTAAAGTLTCTSGVCDTKDNDCGYANGDGPCTSGDGSVVCRSSICGSNGKCTGCTMSSQCPSATPVCDTGTGDCVQCLTSADCSGDTPVCDASKQACVACNGNNGSGSTDACPTPSHPFCFTTGDDAGSCGKCTMNSQCTGTMNVCDTTTGNCTLGCTKDSDCSTTEWCDTAKAGGSCVPKLANGTPLPSMPTSVSTCTSAAGARVCQSGVCDPKDNECGLANGDGVCTTDNQCRDDKCNTTSKTCSPAGCSSDSDCSSADYCNTASGTCTPKQPDGKPCTGADQCESGVCAQSVCGGEIIGSGGLLCAAQPERSSSGGGAALFGLVLAAAGLSRRSRRAA